jgi:hypothetical protein
MICPANGWCCTIYSDRSSSSKPVTFQNVCLIAHADWSKAPAKRWVAYAVLQPDSHWLVGDLFTPKDTSLLFPQLKSFLVQPGCILTGFDFPIGLPSAYASIAGISDFLAALSIFGHGPWAQFYSPADDPSQISLYRPFYPSRPGYSRRYHLEQGLHLAFNQLFRLCEIGHKNRRPACPLFWTIGSQQVGKAAISGWTSLLVPALNDHNLHLHLWPFSGSLHECCLPGHIVAVETYPAEFYSRLGLSFSTPVRRSKRRRADRSSFANQLITWASDHQLELPATLVAKIQSGFGTSLTGEDQFDALVGLYGMIDVILGNNFIDEPHSPVISRIEGWIFGQESP